MNETIKLLKKLEAQYGEVYAGHLETNREALMLSGSIGAINTEFFEKELPEGVAQEKSDLERRLSEVRERNARELTEIFGILRDYQGNVIAHPDDLASFREKYDPDVDFGSAHVTDECAVFPVSLLEGAPERESKDYYANALFLLVQGVVGIVGADTHEGIAGSEILPECLKGRPLVYVEKKEP